MLGIQKEASTQPVVSNGGVTAQDYSAILFITEEAKLTNMYHHVTKRRADFADVVWPSSTVARTADDYSGGPTANTA